MSSLTTTNNDLATTSQKSIIEQVAATPDMRRFLDAVEKGGQYSLLGCVGSLSRIFITQAFRQLPQRYFVIVPNKDRLEINQEDLELLLGQPVATFPSYDRYFFSDEIQNQDILTARLKSYHQLLCGGPGIFILEATALMYPVLPPELIKGWLVSLKVGEDLSRDQLLSRLTASGFNREKMVGEVGEVSVRGAVMDIFAPTMDNPIRLEFDGDTLVSLREFDVDSQRSIQSLDQISFLPLQRDLWSPEDGAPGNFTILHYLQPDTKVILEEPILLRRRMSDHFKEAENSKNNVSSGDGAEFPALISPDEVFERLKSVGSIGFSSLPIPGTQTIDIGSHAPPAFERNMKMLKTEIRKLLTSPRKYSAYLLCDNRGQADRLREIFEEEDTDILPVIEVGSLHEGFIYHEGGIAVFNDHEVFSRARWRRGHMKPRNLQKLLSDRSLNFGDLIVHEDHGIGKFVGLEKISVGESEEECLKIEYQDGDILYLHLDKLHRVEKYSAQEGVVPVLSKLGATDWERLKRKTKNSIKDVAKELIRLYASRRIKKGYAFAPDTSMQRELEAAFEYDETPDQLKATNDIKADMEQARPMDRLVCGDVGYGKTEVALRAAFKSVTNSKQVALLVPTTILAQQHLDTFQERLKQFPVRVEMLSRFKTKKEQKLLVDELKAGGVDIIIGTHRLLSKDVSFKSLGLVIVDEEHRFGVRHKERLKQLIKEVDVLTLTATPIPRTLSMAMMGVRDFSTIDTPPKNRLPVITEIVPFREDIIRNAIMRELDRGGQVYFVHNRVKTIEGIAAQIKKIVPGIRLGIAHGQMAEHALESVMISFLKREFDCLVSTMIVESGLDIPNVNTIIMDKADQFGLAQLYQLRGRVGRSSSQAYAYLIVHDFGSLDETALKRLQTIRQHTELGSGLKVALRDLEIRGAGNILGREQSGFINAVGFELYNKILDQAVHELRNEEQIDGLPPAPKGPDPDEIKVKIDVDAFFPEEYIPDPAERVNLYRQLIEMRSLDSIEKLSEELTDRFGKLPEPARNLLNIMVLKILACTLGAISITLQQPYLRIYFQKNGDPKQLPLFLGNFLKVLSRPYHLFQENEVGIQIQLPEVKKGGVFDFILNYFKAVNESANGNGNFE